MAIPNFNLSFYRYKPNQARRYMSNPRMKVFAHVQPRQVPLKSGQVYDAIREYEGLGIKDKGPHYHLDLSRMDRDFRVLRANIPETPGRLRIKGKTANGEVPLLEFEAVNNLRAEFFEDSTLEDGGVKNRFTWLIETMLEEKCEGISFELS